MLHIRSLSLMFRTLMDLLERASLPWRHHTELFSQYTPCRELFFERAFMYSHSITVLFIFSYYGPLNPQIKNFMLYLPTRYILIFTHREWVASGECSESATWFWTYPSIFVKLLMLPKSCTQTGPLLTAYIPPLTPLAHGLRVPLPNLAYWAFLPTFHLTTE
jgi:hypothetical protein